MTRFYLGTYRSFLRDDWTNQTIVLRFNERCSPEDDRSLSLSEERPLFVFRLNHFLVTPRVSYVPCLRLGPNLLPVSGPGTGLRECLVSWFLRRWPGFRTIGVECAVSTNVTRDLGGRRDDGGTGNLRPRRRRGRTSEVTDTVTSSTLAHGHRSDDPPTFYSQVGKDEDDTLGLRLFRIRPVSLRSYRGFPVYR